ncbi:MAG: SRPBCC family protein [Reyranella sp.]
MIAPYPADDRITTLRMVRLFKAPRERLFAAWTDSRQMAAWFGPPDVSVKSCELDVREGGLWRLSGGRQGQPLQAVSGKYLEVTPPERLVFTWAWHEGGDFAGPREHETVLTLIFKSVGDRTEMTLTHGPFRDKTGVDNHNRGWLGSFDKLDAMLATEAGLATEGGPL